MEPLKPFFTQSFTTLLRQVDQQKSEIHQLKKEMKAQEKFYISELHHPFRYYGRLLRKKFYECIHKPVPEKRVKRAAPKQKPSMKGEACNRLSQLWSVPYDGFSPKDIDGILCPVNKIPEIRQITETVDVIIPIYNGLHHLYRLLPTLFENTTQAHRFIFIDDCSPDTETISYLHQQISQREDCLFLQNEKNLGFPGTVNRAVKSVQSDYFVILNTDVQVPKGWLERMIAPFVDDPTICTTTPFTNAGGVFFGFPHFCEDYKITETEEMYYWDHIFQRMTIQDKAKLEFINGTGYCMGIRKKCWDQMGGLDAATFERGYGEETDLCLRYLDKGWKNVLVPNLFVYHNHGGSFTSEEKKALTAAHLEIVQHRWGKYLELLSDFVKADPWASYRLAALKEKYCRNTDCLFLDLNETKGGACAFRIQQEQALLAEGKTVVSVLYSIDCRTQWTLTFVNPDGRASFDLSSWGQAEEWILALSPKEIRINNLAFNWDFKKVLEFFNGRRHIVPVPLTTDAYPSPIIDTSHPIEFPVRFETEDLPELTFVFATYCRKNDVDIQLSLLAGDDTELYTTTFSAAAITDNAAYSVPLSIQREHIPFIRKIRISSPAAMPDNAISVYLRKGIPCYSYTRQSLEISTLAKPAYCFHDFFSCCPSFFLLNKDCMFCDFQDCAKCLPANPQRILPYEDIQEWRSLWKTFFESCSSLRFFSENTFRLVSRIYDLPIEQVLIEGHTHRVTFKKKYFPPVGEVPLHIAVVGAWFEPKGSRQVIELATLLQLIDPEARIMFYGRMDNEHEQALLKERLPNLVWRGKYDVEDLPELFNQDQISVVFFSSICPETFSFVTQECIEIGVPIVCFNVGAPSDRVRAYEKGYIAEYFSAISVYEKILEARDNEIKQLK